MANIAVTITGPAHGVPVYPRMRQYKATIIEEVVSKVSGETGLTLIRPGTGSLEPGITVFVNGVDVRFGRGLETPLKEDDVVTVLLPSTDT